VQKNERTESKIAGLIAAIDEVHARRQAAIDAENRAAKMFVKAVFEIIDAEIEAHCKQPNSSNDSLMTLQELADFVGYNSRTIQQWIADGDFPDLRAKDGADPRFDRAEILNHMKQHRKNLRGEAAANGKVSPLQRDCKQARSKANVSL
jgi:predicted DNA-binding transcriptional regulator AlpA